MNVAHGLASIRLPDDDGVPVTLGTLWAERPVVLVFVRHFGCVFSREQVNQLKKFVPTLRARGADMVVVGNGGEHAARAFREELALDVPVLLDPGLIAYRAAGLRRDLRSSLSLRRVSHAWRAFKSGYRRRKVQGDLWQQGGVLVFGPHNETLFAHVSSVAGDHPEPDAVLAALPESELAQAAE